MFSERFSPWMTGVKGLAEMVESTRQPVDEDNHFRQWEELMSDSIATTLSLAGSTRDSLCEMAFNSLYGWGCQ